MTSQNNLYEFLFFFIIFSLNAFSQHPANIHLTEKDGLPDIEFYNITEDSNGYIWLAADKGLYRYNGRNFDYYSHAKQKGNAVFGTKLDEKGRVWCNNISGQFFYTENKRLKLFIDLGNILNGELAEFIITQKELIVLLNQNVFRVDIETKEIKKDFDDLIYMGAIETIPEGYLFTKGNFLIYSDKSFKTIDSLELDVFDSYSTDYGVEDRVQITSNGTINLFHFLRFGKNEFYDFDFLESTFHPVRIPPEIRNRKIIYTSFYKNEVWFSTDSGIYVCHLENRRLKLKDVYFKDRFITKIIKDSDTNYWVITKGDGIYVIPNISIYQHQYKKEDLNITKLEKLDNNILIFGTTDGKVGTFNTKTSDYNIIDTSSVSRVSEVKRLPNSDETLIIKEKSIYKLNNSTLNYNKVNDKALIGSKILSINRNNYFIKSSYSSAYLVSKDYKLQRRLIDKRSYTNYYSKNSDKTYISTVDGLFVFNDKLDSQKIQYRGKTLLVKTIVETDNQKIWVSTFNDGIYCISGDKVISHFNSNNGLLSHRISTIKNDGNQLWVSTDEGIQYINTENNKIKNLTKQNGIPSYRISDIEIEDEKVFFSTNTGIFSLDKNKAFKTKKVPKVFISDVSVGLESRLLKSYYELEYDENSIKFTFNANGFNSFLNYQNQFRLVGQSDAWQTDINKSNTVSYYSLPSGNYTFEVKSVLADSNDDSNVSSVSFIIKKAFWKQWWFYGLILLITSIFIYLIFTNKIKKIEKKQSEILQKEQINKQLVLSQLENLRSQMNPHFIFNALNSIQEYIVFNEKELASSYLIKFSRLIRIYLEHSRENEVLLSEEIDALNIYLELEQNRFEGLLDYNVFVSKKIDAKTIKVPSLFIQPYVENAIKHGLMHKENNRFLNIDFQIDLMKNELYCSIEDNGIGIEKSKEINKERYPNHKSFASSANKKRIDLLNISRTNKILVEIKDLKSQSATGTRVIITIPLNK